MAEQSDLERTEPASERRLEQAREEGQVPQSRELATFAVLMAGGVTLWMTGSGFTRSLAGVVRDGLTLDRAAAFESTALLDRLASLAADGLLAMLPLLAVLVAAALAAPLALGGWTFTFKPIAPDWSRVDPIQGFKRMFSVASVVELGKALAKALLVGAVAAWVVWRFKDEVFGLGVESLDRAVDHLGHLLGLAFLFVAGAMVLVVAIDVPVQLWQYYRRLRMTKDEVRREAKETEGDPQVKARIRAQQREMARRRMMAEIPNADVIVTNPTHFAVALKYTAEMRAPKVVAKGAHLLALRIRELGEEHRVPLLEAPPLARALYRHADLGDEIPVTLYAAVAEVMAYVFQLRRWREQGGAAPAAPDELPVPADLDPGAAGAA